MLKQDIEELIEKSSEIIDNSKKEKNLDTVLDILVPVLSWIIGNKLLRIFLGKKFVFLIESFLLIYNKIKEN